MSARPVYVFAAAVLFSGACLVSGAFGEQAQDIVIRQGLEDPPMPMDESQMQWVWGEVVSVDAANRAVVLRYLDYESDQEKEMTMNIGDKTAFDNVGSLDGIKPNDTLSVDYIISADNRNLARNVSKEAVEVAGETQEFPVEGMTP